MNFLKMLKLPLYGPQIRKVIDLKAFYMDLQRYLLNSMSGFF